METESFAKVKAGGDMDCFVFDPANPPAKKAASPPPEEKVQAAQQPKMGVEVFAGKLFAGASLEDAKGVEQQLSAGGQGATEKRQVESPVECLLRLKREIGVLRDDAARAAAPQPPSKARNLDGLDSVLADQRVAPFVPHTSPELSSPDPAETLIIRVRAAEGATYQGTGKQTRAQPEALQQQVEALEKFVGASQVSLRKRLSTLQREVGVVDPVFLVSSARRIKSMLTELALTDQQKRSEVTLPPEVQARFDSLNALQTKHAAAIQEVVKPDGPLKTPNPQQEAAARLIQRLQALEQQQKMVNELVTADKAALATLSENLTANMKVMKANVTSLEQRVQALPRQS